ncbi:receptor-like protein kinase FERONIA isoform X2 [Punica granatum]|nr:receptor-like protein kinase FERONIA isoform X2 [Punica granatum]
MKKRYFLRASHPPPSLLLATILLLLLCRCSAYRSTNEIFISCGSADDSPTPDRLWIGDDDPKYSPLDHQKSLTFKANVPLSSISQVPYTTARLSRSEFSYSIPVTAGPKFIRLHFFPFDYNQNFPRSDALFSVTSGPFTLLWNFSAPLVADYLRNPLFSKEFCLVVEDNQKLNLTFTPSTEQPDAYALINGIEIVSMPPDLYYGNGTVGGRREVEFLGNWGNPLTLNYTNALETVYRINVGGTMINPNDNTGMFRSWTGPDDDYLTEDLSSVLPANYSIPLVFDHIPEYAAPEDVYRTARSMGTNRSITTTYNLTWSFQVDSNFHYLIRLHFCEFQREISKFGDRVFKIYIASLVADSKADIIRWTGGRGIPIYKDYAVYMFAPTSKKINLTVSLHPGPEQYSVYADALLNGVEVFKISSDDDGNLAGPNPDPKRIPDSVQPHTGSGSSKSGGISKKVIAAIAGGSVCGALVLGLLCFLTFRVGSSSNVPSYSDKALPWGSQLYTTTCSSTKVVHSSLPEDLCRRFSLAEIKAATNGFDEIFIIGVGGFGNVYKGYVDGGSTPVAIKRQNHGSQQGVREFTTEIEMLSQLRHIHLVSLIGYCNDGGEMILVYDYMSSGTLRDHLYDTENPPLSWKRRQEICIGAAWGLQYLHMGTKNMIIHRDIKTTNILLDEKWVAKVSDFGLSKMKTSDTSKAHITTVVKGTFGYMDPEYFRFQQLTEKSDVYSFGVVLLEVLCGRPPVNASLEFEQISLAGWAQSCYQKGTLDQIIDPTVKAEITPACLGKFAETAMSCLHKEGMQRPSMNDVVRSLNLALQLQEGAVRQEITSLAPTSMTDGRLQDEEDTESLTDTESDDEVLEL